MGGKIKPQGSVEVGDVVPEKIVSIKASNVMQVYFGLVENEAV